MFSDWLSCILVFLRLALQKESRQRVEGTLYGELGLRFNGGVSIVRHAGVEAGVLLREIGDLETSSSQHLHATLTGDTKEQKLWERRKRRLTVNKSFHPVLL